MGDRADIQVLSQDVVNQIAAGEVVERPAHMVKELLENAIDAGASHIEVHFDQGGRQVRVVDNGHGMSAGDLPLALSRHCTSKIHAAQDLWSLSSFGFRGEALASIASVSKVSLASRRHEDANAFRLMSDFGHFSSVDAVGGDVGTSVAISELFGNQPARRKFLKSDAAEHTQIKLCVKALAMVNPQVSFRVLQKSKLLYFWPACEKRSQRIEEVLAFSPLYENTGRCEGLEATVFLSGPHKTVGTSKQLWFFVQGRWVQDASMKAALLDAYRNLLMHKEFPVAAVFIEAPPDEVDVNIHPTKSQVKFLNPSNAYRAVMRASRSLLEKAPWLDEFLPQNKDPGTVDTEAGLKAPTEAYSVGVSFATPQRSNAKGAVSERASGLGLSSSKTSALSSSPVEQDGSQLKQWPLMANAESKFSGDGFAPVRFKKKEWNRSVKPLEGSVGDSTRSQWKHLQVLGQAHLTYIVTQSEKALVFVDQHAAHERVVFEQLMKAWKEDKPKVQPLLIPEEVALDEEACEVVLGLCGDLGGLGITIEQSGPQNLVVSALPSNIKIAAIAPLLEGLSDEISKKGKSFIFEKFVGDIFATMACHSVVRAGQALSVPEMENLLVQMDEFPLSSFCPHGRPVFVEYPIQKLERDFGRIV